MCSFRFFGFLCLSGLLLLGCEARKSGTHDAAEAEDESTTRTQLQESVVAEKIGLPPSENVTGDPAQRFLKQARWEKSIANDQKRFLSDTYFQAGNRLFADLEYERARENYEKAIQLNPDHEGARIKLRQTKSILGVREDRYLETMTRLTEEKRVRMQEHIIEIEKLLAQGHESFNNKNYDVAAKQFQTVQTLCKYMPYDNVDVSDQMDEAAAMEEKSIQAKAALERELEAQRLRDAQSRALAEEALSEENQAARIRKLVEEAHRYYREKDYAKAESLGNQILRLDPRNRDAKAIIKRARNAEFTYLRSKMGRLSEYEKEQMWMNVEENKIPYHETITYPKNWEEISERQALSISQGEDDDEPWRAKILAKMDTRISFDFGDTPLEDVVDFLQDVTGINIILDDTAFDEDTNINLRVQDMRFHSALQWILRLSNLQYKLKDYAIYISSKDRIQDKPDLKIYDVRDIVGQVRDHAGPDFTLSGEGGVAVEEGFSEEEGSLTGDALVQFIQENIEPESWDTIDADEPISFRGGNLLVVQTPEVHQLISQMLKNFRQFNAIQVAIQARFITYTDSFFQEIGVDWRGLGEQEASNTPGTDRSQNTPPTPPGNGVESVDNQINYNRTDANQTPSLQSLGAGWLTNTDRPYAETDLRGSVINEIGSSVISNFSRLTAAGGLGLQYAFLGDFQLQFILHAINKTHNAEIVQAPNITCFNTQRAHIVVTTERPYIEDVDVTTGDRSVAVDTVIGTIQSGVVLDVRPTVSSDRRYITLEVFPTVAKTLQLRDILTGVGAGIAGDDVTALIQAPRIQIQKVKTTVAIPDGGTIALGGLAVTDDTEQISTIPFLGRIPILNYLFSDRATGSHKQNLMILLNARIIMLEEQEALL